LCISWCKNFDFISVVCQSPQMAHCPLSDSRTCSSLAHVVWFLLWRSTVSLLEGTGMSPTLFHSSTSERRKHQNYVSANEYLKTVNSNYFNFLPDNRKVTRRLRNESLHSVVATCGLFTFWRRLQYCGPGWLVDWKYVEGRKQAGVKIWDIILRVLTGLTHSQNNSCFRCPVQVSKPEPPECKS
jgi:hypothetical protein